MCSPWPPEAHFWEPTLANQLSKIHFLDLRMPEFRNQWAIFLAFIAFLPVRFAFFRLQPPIRISIFAGKNVYFLFMSPLGNLRLALLSLSNAFYITCFILSDWFSHFWCFLTCFHVIFLQILWKCAPRPRWEAYFRRAIFANILRKTMFPYPKRLQNRHVWRAISALCCSKNSMFRRLSGKWPALEVLFSITSVLACSFKHIFVFSVLTLPLFLGSSTDLHFRKPHATRRHRVAPHRRHPCQVRGRFGPTRRPWKCGAAILGCRTTRANLRLPFEPSMHSITYEFNIFTHVELADFEFHAFFHPPAIVCQAWIEGRRCALPRGPSI